MPADKHLWQPAPRSGALELPWPAHLVFRTRKHAQTAALCLASRKQWVARSLIRLSTWSKCSYTMGKKKSKAASKAPSSSSGYETAEEYKLNIDDHREFPSLSGAPQAQQNTSAQQMWANPTLRTTQQQTIQRPQGQAQQQQQQGPAGQTSNQQIQSQAQDDTSSQFSGAGDDYRYGGQGGVGQLSGGAQPQTGNIEEFPPLGGAAGEIGPDRRAGMIQNAAAFASNSNTSAFPGLGQTRNGLSSPTDSQQDRTVNPTVGGRGLPSAG